MIAELLALTAWNAHCIASEQEESCDDHPGGIEPDKPELKSKGLLRWTKERGFWIQYYD